MKFWLGSNPDVAFATYDDFSTDNQLMHWIEIPWDTAAYCEYIMVLEKDKTWQLWKTQTETYH